MFNIGDYITGKDQSYKRSIYQVLRLNLPTIEVGIVCYSGQVYRKEKSMLRRADEFRLATAEELRREFLHAYGNELIEFVYRLID